MSLAPFALRVVDWQRQHGRNHLPWSGADAYGVWLSEVMLQQTQVATVLPYYAAFIQRFPTIVQLAQAPIETVLAMWAGLGYYSRARNLHRCANTVVSHFQGVFPSDVLTLQTLPGIGPSTAAAIASLAHNQRAAILDGNVKRVHARHGGITGWAGEAAVSKRLWQRAEQQLISLDHNVATDHHRRYTQGLMDLGATVCHVKQPLCTACPIQADCIALKSNATEQIPTPRPKKVLPIQTRHALIVHSKDGVWLERRAPTGLWGGLLSLPEAPDATELKQWLVHPTLGTAQLSAWPLHQLKHTFTHYQLHWVLWSCATDETQESPFADTITAQFVLWQDLNTVGVPKAVLKAMAGRP